MNVRGIEVGSATIGAIASDFDIRHSDACRNANPRGRGRTYRCRCDFFERVGEHLEAPDPAELSAAQAEAKRLHDAGYQQTSRKYSRVARLVGGSWEGEVEVSEAVLHELRKLAKAAWDEHVAGWLAHFATVKDLAPGDSCEYRLADDRLGRDHAPTTGWLPGTVAENCRLGSWKIKPAGSQDLVRARPENLRRPGAAA